jgi:type II secretory pathway pseudopilin PulG
MRFPSAFTRIELLVVVVVLLVLLTLATLLLPGLARAKAKATRISCINNQKEIGTAYRLWANDNGDLVPPQQIQSKGGWKDLLARTNLGPICFTNYAIMHREFGESPKLVICPSDERQAASDFTNHFSNLSVSYFVGVSANDVYPQSIFGGDRNLGPGSVPANDYGYSPSNGMGNDVAVPIVGPTCWSLKMHSDGNTAGAGNILLGDGSAQQVSSASFRMNWLRNAEPTTNRPAGHAPSVPSIRLVFP